MVIRTLIVLLLIPTLSCAGSVWQKQSNEPCAAQVIVGDSGDDNDSYIIPADNSDYGGYEPDYEDPYESSEDLEGPVPDSMENE